MLEYKAAFTVLRLGKEMGFMGKEEGEEENKRKREKKENKHCNKCAIKS